MNTIYLYDVSAAVMSGAYSNTGGPKPRKDYNIYSFPTGGLYSFFDRFTTDVNNSKPGDLFVACFDGTYNKLLKKLRCPHYKANRAIQGFDDVERPEGVQVTPEQMREEIAHLPTGTREKVCRRAGAGLQIRVLKTFLPKIGVTVLCDSTLEADDWIYSVCYHLGRDYNVFLRADDSDLADCAAYVTNFKMWSVSGRQELTPEIGGNFRKIFHGEKGDGIPCCTNGPDAKNVRSLEDAIIDGLEDISILDSVDEMNRKFYIKEITCETIRDNYFLVTPLIQNNFSLNDEPLNMQAYLTLLSALRFKANLKRLGYTEYIESAEVTEIQKFLFSILPDFVKDFFREMEFKAPGIPTVAYNTPGSGMATSEEYLLKAAAKYNIL